MTFQYQHQHTFSADGTVDFELAETQPLAKAVYIGELDMPGGVAILGGGTLKLEWVDEFSDGTVLTGDIPDATISPTTVDGNGIWISTFEIFGRYKKIRASLTGSSGPALTIRMRY